MLDLKLIQHAIALAQHRNFARTAELPGKSLDWRTIPQAVLAGKLDIGIVELTSLEDEPG